MRLQMRTAHAAARSTLIECLAMGALRFHTLFSGENCAVGDFCGDLAPLRELQLLEVSDGEARAFTPIVAFEDLFLKCDSPSLDVWERVFPLHDDESLLLARWATAEPGDRVLEVGTGAGIAALRMASQGADKVIATDVNPRVSDYFAFNAELNGLTDRVEYANCDVFTDLEGETFDVIVSNPPFVPVPAGVRYFLHSDGGRFGTSILERFSTGWEKYSRASTRVCLLALSLSSSHESRVSRVLPAAELYAIYGEPHMPLGEFAAAFRDVPDVNSWEVSLRGMGYDRIGYFALAAGANTRRSIEALKSAISVQRQMVNATPWSDYSWSMTARLKRYLSTPTQL